MSWKPLENIPRPWLNTDGTLLVGWWLIAFEAGTTTRADIATDTAGTGAAAKFETNSEGYLSTAVPGGTIVVPFVDRDVKLAFVPTEAEADAGDISNAIWPTADNVKGIGFGFSPDPVDTVAALKALDAGAYLFADTLGYTAKNDGGAGSYYFVNGDSTTANDYTVIADDGGLGRWFLVTEDNEFNSLQAGATGNNTTDDIARIKIAITVARDFRDSSGISSATLNFPTPSEAYKISAPIPIVKGVNYIGASRGSTSVQTDSCIGAYTANYSSGVFTDNLDQGFGSNISNVSIQDIFFEDVDGDITGSSPDSSSTYTHMLMLNALLDSNVVNVRVTVRSNRIGGIYLNNSFRSYVEQPYINKSTGVGGYGMDIGSVSNDCLLNKVRVVGDFHYGVRVGNPDSCTLVGTSSENCLGGVYLNGDCIRMYGGYVEGNDVGEIDLGWDSPTTCFDWIVDSPWFQGAFNRLDLITNYSWVKSGSGTNEYYPTLAADGGSPDFPKPSIIQENTSDMTAGTVGSLAAGEWGYADNDGLGEDRPYVRLSDNSDPDSKAASYLRTSAHAIRLGRCQGGTVVRPQIQGSYDSKFYSETRANGNFSNTIEISVNDAAAPDLTTLGLAAGGNIVRVVGKVSSDHRLYKEWSTENNTLVEQELNQRGAEFCMFYVDVQNNAGTLEARITDGSSSTTVYNTCLQTSSTSYVALGADVSSGQDFGASGIGRLSGANSYLVLDSNAQTATEQSFICGPVWSDNGTIGLTAEVRVTSRNVNGTTQFRPEINFSNITTGASWSVNTTNLPTTKSVRVPILGFIK